MDVHRRRCFPIDLIAEILLRLPVRSLLRFRCVSKAWGSLILDPAFIRSQRRRSRRKPLVLIERDHRMPNDAFTIYSLTSEGALEEYFTSPDLDYNATVVSSSPDLLLFRQVKIEPRGRTFFLLNPSTGERMMLPESRNSGGGGYCSFGVDYVPSLGRFKVARFFSRRQPCPKTAARSGCEVLVVGADRSWRPANDPPFTVECNSRAPLVNGAVHIFSSFFLDQGIAAFDLRQEVWRVIQVPPGFCFHGDTDAGVLRKHADLRELRGSLYLSCFSPHKLETWALEDYENGNWVKQYSIDIQQLWTMRDIEPWTKVYPVVIEDDGNILIILSSIGLLMFRYDIEDKVFTKMGYFRPPCVYVENYLPLN